jgi:hypothetical protein
MTDPDIQHIHALLDKLVAGRFFGQLAIKFSNGKITSAKQEENLELPSYAIRKAAEHAHGKHETHR